MTINIIKAHALVAFLFLALTAPRSTVASTVFVDFDGIDATGGPVGGSTLDAYLAGYGITITNIVGPGGPTVANATTGVFGPPNFFVPPSMPNFIWQPTSNSPIGYQLNFSQEADQVSFTRIQMNAQLSPSGLVVADWRARAIDAMGNTVAQVGEGYLASYAMIPSAAFTLSGSGIKGLVVERTSTNYYAGLNTAVIDNLSVNLVPEPAMTTAAIGATALLAFGAFRFRRGRQVNPNVSPSPRLPFREEPM